MLSEFFVYLRLGFEHITDVAGMDHLLFVAALTAVDVKRPKRLFWLVTAFTVGHSFTLVLATLGLISVGTGLVEVLIPLTIVATCAVNGTVALNPGHRLATVHDGQERIRYMFAVGFGLIHGLGFSAFLRAALGSEESILLPLFAFNTGLEVGQLVIVLLLSVLAYFFIRLTRLPEKVWPLGVSGAAGVAALFMLIRRL
jgi:hypothetical protein